MSKKVMLTGYFVQGSSKFRLRYYVYSDPANDYEHFIERYYHRNHQSGKTKRSIIQAAQIQWKQFIKTNPDEL